MSRIAFEVELKKWVNHETGARKRAFLHALKRNVATSLPLDPSS